MKSIVKYQKTILFKSIWFFCILFLISCRSNPHNDPPIQGNITVTLNSSKQICFTPNFRNARIGSNIEGSKPYYITEISNVTFDLYNSDGHIVWELLPAQQPIKFKSGDTVCMDSKKQGFEEKFYSSIIQDQKYGINMRGNTIDDRAVFFSTIFFYKDSHIQYTK